MDNMHRRTASKNQFVPSSLFLFLCLCLASFVSAVLQIHSNQFGQTRFGDVRIYRKPNFWQCDRIRCPRGSVQCVVQQTKSPSNPTEIIRRNFCLSAMNRRLVDKNFTDIEKPGQNSEFTIINTNSGSYVLEGQPDGDSTNVKGNLDRIEKEYSNTIENIKRAIANGLKDMQNAES